MLSRMTRRRALAGCLLLAGALLLGLGTWQRSWPTAALGMACWTAALVGIGLVLIQRINTIKQLSTFNHLELQKLSDILSRSTQSLKKYHERTTKISSKLNRISANLD